MSQLTSRDRLSLLTEALGKSVAKGQLLFQQGAPNSGIYIIQSGSIRTFYISPNGRQITLGYWTSDQLVGGPEVFGRGAHLWSGEAIADTKVLFLSGSQLERLCREIPALSFVLIDILIQKGHRFSVVLQMLGTKSSSQRLAQVLILLSSDRPSSGTGEVSLPRAYTHEEIASMVGVTRQWVSISLKRFEKGGLLRQEGRRIIIVSQERIRAKAKA